MAPKLAPGMLLSLTIDTHVLIVTSFFQDLLAPAEVGWFAMAQHAVETILLASIVRVAQIVLNSIASPTEGLAIVEKSYSMLKVFKNKN